MTGKRWWIEVGAALAALAVASSAEATSRDNARAQEEVRIAACIRKAADGKPWLERTLWGLRDQEGGWIGAEIPNTDGSHDLGPLQVNSWWAGRIAILTGRPSGQVRRWLVHDPCFNIQAARWIFLSGLAVTGDYWKAVGVYHSPTGWRQRRYAMLVAGKLTRRFGAQIFVKSARHGEQ